MCDLWKYTTVSDTPPGAIPKQIEAALEDIRCRQSLDDGPGVIKLYNAGSFFDPRAVPECDYPNVAHCLREFDRIVVECHPSLVGARVDAFLAALNEAACGPRSSPPALEVALGLETAHPGALEQLNKKFTLPAFARAAARLRRSGVDVRVFLLVSPPFVPRDEQDMWLMRAVDFSLSCDVTAISLIPTRSGNGAMETLQADGSFASPTLSDLERSLERALAFIKTTHPSTRVIADLWNVDALHACPHCRQTRVDRLKQMNLAQSASPAAAQACGCAS
jgi:radical SAM enzyme (TIGR01210 family)